MIDDVRLAALRERADRRNFLTIDDVREVFPVETMSADEVAMLVLRLEEAGITVEIDPNLLGASRRRDAISPEAAAIRLPDDPARGPIPPKSTPGSASAPARGASAAPEPVRAPEAPGPDAWKFVAAAGALVALGAFIVFYLMR